MLPLLLAAAALAQEGYAPVLVRLDETSSLDWSALELQVSSGSDKTVGAWKDKRVQEQDALDRLAPRIAALAEDVCVTPDRTAGDLMGSADEVATRLRDGLRGWRVAETRYHSSGRVEMDGVLDLHAWLRPAIVSLASARPLGLAPEGATGLVIDARGLPFDACLAPTVLTPDGSAVVRAQLLTTEAASLASPVVYVTDPADPRAQARAGRTPLLARAASVRGGALVLDPTSASAIAGKTETLAAGGKVVIVLSAPGAEGEGP